jgi:protein TonB
MQSQRRLILASALLHLVLLAVLLHARRLHVEPTRLPGTDHGTHISLIYSPGSAARTEASLAAVKPVPSKLTQAYQLPPKPVAQAASSISAPSAANPNAAQGGDARGSGNVTVALATFFPTPHPDLTQLPHGTRGDVIVDVTIDEQGHIVESQVAQRIGHGVDETVLAVIQTWTFKPATKDGVAVPSQQELLFHYERG